MQPPLGSTSPISPTGCPKALKAAVEGSPGSVTLQLPVMFLSSRLVPPLLFCTLPATKPHDQVRSSCAAGSILWYETAFDRQDRLETSVRIATIHSQQAIAAALFLF